MPNNQQVTIPGVTHDLGRMTKPDIFNTKVMQFLAKYSQLRQESSQYLQCSESNGMRQF
jgi:hypothetical protein